MKMILKALLRFLPCAFDATNMNRVQVGTVTLWVYKSNDLMATILGSGYFDSYVNELRKGDRILISGDLDGTPACDACIVSSADNATPVTVAAQLKA